MRNPLLTTVALAATTAALGCGGDDDGHDPDRPFGDTAIVVVVNPTPNDGNTAAVPGISSDIREGVGVDAEPGGGATTDASGLGVVDEVAMGDLQLIFDSGPVLPSQILSDGDVYDLAVAYDGDTVTAFDGYPIRYGVGGEILEFATDADPAEVAEALGTDGNIVFFEDGVYTGDLMITGEDVIFFGEGLTERQVVIDGSVEVRGTGVRIRGFTITGDLTVFGNQFGMSFSVVQGNTQINGNPVSFLRNAFCGNVDVPSSNASLLDNEGLAPMADPDPALCM